MAKLYLYERQTEYWTSRGIEEYFCDAGYEIVTFPLSQIAEHEVPFDFIFFEKATCKLFGIQYKALYHNERDFWFLNQMQHDKLQHFGDWAYYCLSEMISAQDHRIAIHRSLFVPVSINSESRLYVGKLDAMYYRWGGFVNGLERCTVGRKVAAREEVEKTLTPLQRGYIKEVDQDIIDIFVANLENRLLLHLDSRS